VRKGFVDSPALRQKILDRLGAGDTMLSIERTRGMPTAATITREWVKRDPEWKRDLDDARQAGWQRYADEIIEIADEITGDWRNKTEGKGPHGPVLNREHIERARLRIDARKWLLSKLIPATYGDKIEHSGNPSAPIVIQMLPGDGGL